jgi:hypothetical protein
MQGDIMLINSYKFGFILIDGNDYTGDVIVFPDKVKGNWWRQQGHSVCVEDLKSVFEYSPNVLVIGTGAEGLMEVPQTTKDKLKQGDIELIQEKTPDAVEIFNRKIEKGVKVVGAFHLTC